MRLINLDNTEIQKIKRRTPSFSVKRKNDIKEFAIRKLRRIMKYLSITEVSELTGYTYPTLYRWLEKGKSPSIYSSINIIIFCYEVEKIIAMKIKKNNFLGGLL